VATIRKPKTALRFSKPAGWWGGLWREGVPTGNGTIGASVLGGAGSDTIIINHSDLRWQGHVGTLQDVAGNVKTVRGLIDADDFRRAEDIISSALITKSYRPQLSYPLPLCDLKVKQSLEKPPKEYCRLLSMETGEVEVSFRDGATKYERSLFVSRENDTVVYEIVKVGSKTVDVTLSLDMHDRTNIRTAQAVSKLPDSPSVRYENFFMFFAARSDNGTDFGAVARINFYGGSQEVLPYGVRVKGADKVLVTMKVFVESQKDKEWKFLRTELAANKLTYEKLLKEHVGKHAKYFNTAEFDLEAEDRDKSVEELMEAAESSGVSPDALIEKLWYYGRFLAVTGTNPNGRLLNPTGLWCGDYKAASAQVDASGSMQTIYSHLLAGGLQELMLPVFNFYESIVDDLRKNAQRLYDCRGIFVPSVVAPASGLLGIVEPSVIHFTGAAGWIAQLFFDYYLFTADEKFLKAHAMPFMKDAAQFYEEFFKLTPAGKYESSPSYSPDNTPLNLIENDSRPAIARNAAIDFAIARELLTNLIKGSKITKLYQGELEKWVDMLEKIPAYSIYSDGTVREYIDPKLTENQESRSFAQFYPLYPGTEPVEKNPELLKAYASTAKKRFQAGIHEQTSASLARLANIYARLSDGENALDIITAIVRNMTMNNLVTARNDWRGMGVGTDDYWAPYSIEGNMGVTSAIQEMVLSSRDGLVKILPAVPESWKKGSVSGILTRTGAEVDLAWDQKKGVATMKIKSRRNAKFDVLVPSGYKKVKGTGAEKFDSATGVLSLELSSGKVTTYEFR
jgi:alpha-L-fucosidase 2